MLEVWLSITIIVEVWLSITIIVEVWLSITIIVEVWLSIYYVFKKWLDFCLHFAELIAESTGLKPALKRSASPLSEGCVSAVNRSRTDVRT